MNITIFGASGQTGKILLEKALSEGHHITAYVRSENSIDKEHSQLKIIKGELSDNAKIKEALSGAEVCISTLGGRSLRKRSEEITNGIKLIVEQLEAQSSNNAIAIIETRAGDAYRYR